MAKLIVAGAAGRMGRTLTSLIVQQSSHSLVGAVEAKGVKGVGSDAGEIAGVGAIGVRIGDDYAAIASPDTVTLDFTNATASLEHLAVAAAKGAAIVIGSTGFTPEMEAQRARIGAQNPHPDRPQHEYRDQRADQAGVRGRRAA